MDEEAFFLPSFFQLMDGLIHIEKIFWVYVMVRCHDGKTLRGGPQLNSP